MQRINWTSVIVGGALAGVIVNVIEWLVNGVLINEVWKRQFASMGKATTGTSIVHFIIWGLLIGFMAIWVYAAIRAHYGPGPKTAVIAAVMVWIVGYALPNYFLWASTLFGPRLMAASAAAGLVEIIVATLAGAWAYKPAGEVVAIEPGVSA